MPITHNLKALCTAVYLLGLSLLVGISLLSIMELISTDPYIQGLLLSFPAGAILLCGPSSHLSAYMSRRARIAISLTSIPLFLYGLVLCFRIITT